MKYEIVQLNPEHVEKLLAGGPSQLAKELERAYFYPGGASRCVLVDGEPVLAGGIVNMQWRRGEAWILTTDRFRANLRTYWREIKKHLPELARECGFVRVQATCIEGTSKTIARLLGFTYEGTMKKFGPSGETCSLYARIFEVTS